MDSYDGRVSTWRVERMRFVLKPMSGFLSTTLFTIELSPFERIVGSGVAKLSSLHRRSHRSHALNDSTAF